MAASRPVAYRVPRADVGTAGQSLGTEWRLFQDERTARDAADALGTDYQGLYVRDGSGDVAQTAPLPAKEAEAAFHVIVSYFDNHGINDARAGAFNILDRMKGAGLTIVPAQPSQGAGNGEAVAIPHSLIIWTAPAEGDSK